MTVTFVIEAMASANAIVTWRHIQHRKRVSSFKFTFDKYDDKNKRVHLN